MPLGAMAHGLLRVETGVDMPTVIDGHRRFAPFSPEERRRLLSLGVTHIYPADGHIYLEGAAATTIHFLLEGVVKLNRSMPNGREVLVDLLGPGDVPGEAAALAGLPHFTSAQARSNVKVFSVDREPYLELLRSKPAYFASYLEESGSQAMRITRRLAEVLAGPVPSRLAYLLLMLDERFGENSATGVEIKLSRRELADMTGMRIESAIRALRLMEERKLLSFLPHGVAIKRRKCLELVAYLGCDCDSGECPLGAAKEFA